jgi:hypothetical protein
MELWEICIYELMIAGLVGWLGGLELFALGN